MHVLFIAASLPSDYNPVSGIFFEEQAKALSKQNIKVGLLSANYVSLKYALSQKKWKYGLEEENRENFNVLNYCLPSIPKMRRFRLKRKFIKGKQLFKDYIQAFGKPDIVHLHTYEDGQLAMYIKEIFNIPYVVTEHYTHFFNGIARGKIKKAAAETYMKSSYNMCVGGLLCSTLKEKFGLDFSFVPNLIDTDFFYPLPQTANNDSFELISVGGLNKRKNFDALIKAFADVYKNNKKIHLTIVGNGEEKAKLKSLVKKLKIEDVVKLPGALNRLPLRDRLQKSDAFIMSSKRETFGVVLIEAMSCGLPVASVKNGGAESIITSPELGILCEPTVKSLSDAINKLIKRHFNPEKLRKHVEDNFSEKAVTSKWIAIYKKVLKSFQTQ